MENQFKKMKETQLQLPSQNNSHRQQTTQAQAQIHLQIQPPSQQQIQSQSQSQSQQPICQQFINEQPRFINENKTATKNIIKNKKKESKKYKHSTKNQYFEIRDSDESDD